MDFQAIFDSLGFDPKMALFSSINFLIFFLVLNKFVFGKIGQAVYNRQQIVEKSLKDAATIEKELAEVQESKEKILKDASIEANEIIKKHQETGNEIITKAKEKAITEAEEIRGAELQKIEAEKQTMLRDLKDKTADLTIKAANKVISGKIDAKEDKKMILEYLNTLKIEE